MKSVTCGIVIFSTYLIFFTGCATYHAQEVGPTPIMQAEQEIPEDQLMDVGILVFESKEVDEETTKIHCTRALPGVRFVYFRRKPTVWICG